jgi:hypothetical protein
MNIPYVKQYDKHGIVTNPIKGKYVNRHPNRRQTRQKDERKFTNGKGVKLLVKYVGNGQFMKFCKRLQTITKMIPVTVPAAYAKDGTLIRKETTYFKPKVIRTIVHYDEVNARA